jgi:hypothetical protein
MIVRIIIYNKVNCYIHNLWTPMVSNQSTEGVKQITIVYKLCVSMQIYPTIGIAIGRILPVKLLISVTLIFMLALIYYL